MSIQLDRMTFSQVRAEYPDRFQKANLAATSIRTVKPGEYAVERGESDNAHPCSLVLAAGEAYGHCNCDGYSYHAGPCSHLCALWRAHQHDLLELPTGRIESASVSIPSPEERADQQETLDQPVAPDGGGRHGREL